MTNTAITGGHPALPIFPPLHNTDKLMTLELQNGMAVQGYSFGADKSTAGELVFQTGMVGYPESITDPSYEGQILVITFPLVGNYGVPSREAMDEVLNIPKYFESNRIHVAGLVVASYTEQYSHFLAESSLGAWLKEQGIPAIYGVDTRGLTKLIRTEGSTLCRIMVENEKRKSLAPAQWRQGFEETPFVDPNVKNLVQLVSVKEPKLYTPHPDKAVKGPDGKTIRVLAVDVGMKYNQIRCFVHRGVELKVVPWDYDITAEKDYDGLFVSNGPGDPETVSDVSEKLAKILEAKKTPVFGICLGHQLLAKAAGASTLKLKFGNRGHNIPATNLISGRCYITSQNHGYAVDVNTLTNGWKELFVNANDNSNEGIYHTELPYFSVQFHPESTPGPRDTEFLFDTFIQTILEHKASGGKLKPVSFPGGLHADNMALHPKVKAKKVLVLGSGGLSIGQAGEFDYSGSQAIKALREEGIYTILINPNIATIQTSKGLADKVYFLPVNPDFVRKVIKHEKPDAIYVTFGGQTALSVGIALKDEFESLGVKVLGTPIETIITTEDRELFARSMEEIGEKCAKSASASTVQEALDAVKDIGFPVIVRAAYALGGLGSGFANNTEELIDLCHKAFAASPQVLVERSMKGWKEIEYEVVRDAYDNCITVCNMENFDPLGIHTGDSIVVAPSQTLSDEDYNMLRTTAVNVIRHLGVVGECNIQYALNPFSKEYCIIEVNARLSRSSALASKATGYPLAFIAAKLGLNIPLNEIRNAVTKVTCACFEPSLDYVVVKIPRWDLKKFTRVSKYLSSSMKSVGEVMAIGRTFEEAIQKAIRSTDYHNLGFNATDALMSIDIDTELQTPSDQRLFAIANALDSGYTVDRIWELTRIDKWFLHKLHGLTQFAHSLEKFAGSDLSTSLSSTVLREAKQLGFEDRQIAKFVKSNELSIRALRLEHGIRPFVKQIDTVAAEFPAFTNYLYMTYNADSHDLTFEDHGAMVLGSGVYRIGSSVEFDWCAVRAVRTLREQGQKTIMINYNPETVSTDYDEADRLYFEVINLERVLDIYELEQSAGVVISMGGQTSNNIALSLHRQNVKILGTSPEMIDSAENRYKFSRMLDRIGVDQPAWKELTSFAEAEQFADNVGYPVLVRPSYVLSGAAMNTVYSRDDLESYLKQAVEVSREYPVVITKYIENAKEIEMDAVAKDGQMIMHVVSEHVENAGVHSGDATLIVPAQDLDPETVRRIVDATAKIGEALNVSGPYNIQFIAKDNEIKVIECNVRASRSFPFVSKVMGVDLIEMATKVIAGLPVEPYPVTTPPNYVAIKVPQFSFSRLSGADPVLGVEMASTGEVATFGRNKQEAYVKSLIATGIKLPKKNVLLSIGSYKEKLELLPSVKKLHKNGYKLFATAGTASFIQEHGIPVQYLELLDTETEEESDEKKEYSLTQHLANNLIDLYINLPSANRFRRPSSYMSKGYRTRRMAVDFAVPLVTNVKCAKLLIEAICQPNLNLEVSSIDAQSAHEIVSVPGLINVSAFVPEFNAESFKSVGDAHLASGFAMARVLPTSLDGAITDLESLVEVQEASSSSMSIDYNLSVAATGDNVDSLASSSLTAGVGSLVMGFNFLSNNVDKVAAVSSHFNIWPVNKPIVSDASSTDLASLLLLASLNNRAVHITNVTRRADIALIAMAKERGLCVTCDVSVHALFISQDSINLSFLPTLDDQNGLWENLENIDVFAVGSLPTQIAKELGRPVVAGMGLCDVLPLLFSAVRAGKLTVADITSRMYTNPRSIFDLHESTFEIEIDGDRPVVVDEVASLLDLVPSAVSPIKGIVERAESYGVSYVRDGKIVAKTAGKNVSGISSSAGPAPFASPKTISSPMVDSRKVSFGRAVRPSVHRHSIVSNLESALGDEVSSPGPLASAGTVKPLISNLLKDNPFYQRDVISVQDFSRSDLHVLFSLAHEMRLAVERQGSIDILKGKVLATLFFEPSTRTSTSFEVAMKRLGGQVANVATSTSSIQKGETLQDSVRTLASYADAIVLRHPDEESASIAAKFSPVPIVNGGNGALEHPTQAFLDLFTIREELGTVNGLTITFMGDLLHGRPVHSLCHLLRYYDVKVNLVSPKEMALPSSLRDELKSVGKLNVESETLTDDIIANSDIIYCTRVQKERFSDLSEYERLRDSYVVDNSTLSKAKKHMCLMHPLPRVNEIKEEVDFDHRATYFRQMRYGLFVRMALLAMIMGN